MAESQDVLPVDAGIWSWVSRKHKVLKNRSVLKQMQCIIQVSGKSGGNTQETVLAEPVTSMSFFAAVSVPKAFQRWKLHSPHAV